MDILFERVIADLDGCGIGQGIAGGSPDLRRRPGLNDFTISVYAGTCDGAQLPGQTGRIVVDVMRPEIIEDRVAKAAADGEPAVDSILIAKVEGAFETLF